MRRILAAISAARVLGVDNDTIKRGAESITGVKGRIEVVPTDTDYTVIIDYAHTPDALFNLLSAVRGFVQKRIILVFGCGGDRDKEKRPMMGRIASELADYIIVTSDNPRTEEPIEIIEDILAGLAQTKSEHAVIPQRKKAIEHALGEAAGLHQLLGQVHGHVVGGALYLAVAGAAEPQEVVILQQHLGARP